MTQSSPEIFKVLESHRGQKHVVVLQNFPDPDAIASGFAHRLLSNIYAIETVLLYSGKISHPQNTALVKLLGIELIPYSSTFSFEGVAGAVFVDNQGTTSDEIVRALEAANVPTLIVVDHHDRQDRLKPAFSDIRPVGAASTLYAEYLEQGPLTLSKSQREHVLVTTALLHGLITDTGGFVNAGPEDFQAASFLSQFHDPNLLNQVMLQARSKQTLDVIRQALERRLVVESFSLAGIGYLRAEDRDAIPQAADFLLTEENVHTTIVYGIVLNSNRQEAVVGSMRTTKLTLSPDEFLKDALGANADQHPYGGGKATAGGFEIPIGFLAGDDTPDYRELKWQLYDTQIKHKLLAKIGVDPNQALAAPNGKS
jgi:nanoRNase/pAp phosphatase (c-di-AMP/oligoRNAs hydrolase)